MSAKPFPPRIMTVLRELADRGGNEFAGPDLAPKNVPLAE